jgi:hypothetical protein
VSPTLDEPLAQPMAGHAVSDDDQPI